MGVNAVSASQASARTGARSVSRDIWEGSQPGSDPVLVISSAVPGVRYIGRMVGTDFHVIFQHVAQLVGAEHTQLYQHLCRRLLPGWQVWKEPFLDNGQRRSLDCLTFAGVKAFLGGLSVPALPGCDPRRLEQVMPAFAGSMPEGTLYPITGFRPYSLSTRHIPETPLRAVCVDRYLMPVHERDADFWVPMRHMCRWFGLDYNSCSQYLNECRGDFMEKSWSLPGLGGQRQLYVPMRALPDCLLALASFWRARGTQTWERAVFLAHMTETYIRCAMPMPGSRASAESVRYARPASSASQARTTDDPRPEERCCRRLPDDLSAHSSMDPSMDPSADLSAERTVPPSADQSATHSAGAYGARTAEHNNASSGQNTEGTEERAGARADQQMVAGIQHSLRELSRRVEELERRQAEMAAPRPAARDGEVVTTCVCQPARKKSVLALPGPGA